MQAIADHFGVKMYIVTSYREGEIIEINPNGPLRSARVLYLSFWAEVCCFAKPYQAAWMHSPAHAFIAGCHVFLFDYWAYVWQMLQCQGEHSLAPPWYQSCRISQSRCE